MLKQRNIEFSRAYLRKWLETFKKVNDWRRESSLKNNNCRISIIRNNPAM